MNANIKNLMEELIKKIMKGENIKSGIIKAIFLGAFYLFWQCFIFIFFFAIAELVARYALDVFDLNIWWRRLIALWLSGIVTLILGNILLAIKWMKISVNMRKQLKWWLLLLIILSIFCACAAIKIDLESENQSVVALQTVSDDIIPFDPITGKSNIWYTKEKNGQITLFPGPGFNWKTAQKREPVTAEILEEYENQQNQTGPVIIEEADIQVILAKMSDTEKLLKELDVSSNALKERNDQLQGKVKKTESIINGQIELLRQQADSLIGFETKCHYNWTQFKSKLNGQKEKFSGEINKITTSLTDEVNRYYEKYRKLEELDLFLSKYFPTDKPTKITANYGGIFANFNYMPGTKISPLASVEHEFNDLLRLKNSFLDSLQEVVAKIPDVEVVPIIPPAKQASEIHTERIALDTEIKRQMELNQQLSEQLANLKSQLPLISDELIKTREVNSKLRQENDELLTQLNILKRQPESSVLEKIQRCVFKVKGR